MGSQRQVGAGEMTSLPRFLVFALFLLSSVHARVVRRETNSLIEAAQEGNLERVRRLVSDAHAPDVNELGPDDRTPLIFAASFGDPAIVQELVQAGALVDTPPWSASSSQTVPMWTPGTPRDGAPCTGLPTAGTWSRCRSWSRWAGRTPAS